MSKPTTNGEKVDLPTQTYDHIRNYPLTKDIVSVYESTSIGQASINVTSSVYVNLVAPVLPVLQTPYSFVAPYIIQIDDLSNSTLDYVDSHVPAIKQTNMHDIKNLLFELLTFPINLYFAARDYITDVYLDEYSKTARENDGRKDIFTAFWAALSTILRVVAEVMRACADYVQPKRQQARDKFEQMKAYAYSRGEEAKQQGHDMKENGKKNGGTYIQYTKEQIDRALQIGQQKKGELDGQADEFESKANHVGEKAEEHAQTYADAAKESAEDAQKSFEEAHKEMHEGN